jgi:hypothetical protein
MTTNVGSARDARVVPAGGSGGPARQSRPANGHQRVIMIVVGLAAAASLPRKRAFQAGVITLAIGVAAIARIGRENQTRSIARLADWDRRRNPRYQQAAQAREA